MAIERQLDSGGIMIKASKIILYFISCMWLYFLFVLFFGLATGSNYSVPNRTLAIFTFFFGFYVPKSYLGAILSLVIYLSIYLSISVYAPRKSTIAYPLLIYIILDNICMAIIYPELIILRLVVVAVMLKLVADYHEKRMFDGCLGGFTSEVQQGREEVGHPGEDSVD